MVDKSISRQIDINCGFLKCLMSAGLYNKYMDLLTSASSKPEVLRFPMRRIRASWYAIFSRGPFLKLRFYIWLRFSVHIFRQEVIGSELAKKFGSEPWKFFLEKDKDALPSEQLWFLRIIYPSGLKLEKS